MEGKMPLDERWDEVSDDAWAEFARDWLAELALDRGQRPEDGCASQVMMMNFTASPAAQWKFILHAMAAADSPDGLSHIAAGPVEHLLWKHGRDYIGKFEEFAAADPKWREMMGRVWKHLMSDEVWERVQAIRGRGNS